MIGELFESRCPRERGSAIIIPFRKARARMQSRMERFAVNCLDKEPPRDTFAALTSFYMNDSLGEAALNIAFAH